MPFLKEIVDLVNADLDAGKLIDGKRFVKNLNGLCELQPRNNAEDQDTLPVIVNTRDYSTFAGLDDRYSLQLYHRILSVEQQESPLSYGDGQTNGREVATMRCVVFADKQRTRLDQYQVSFMIRSSLNRQYSGVALEAYSGLLGATIEATTDNYDGVEVYNQEYGLEAQTYPVRMHQCLFTIDYTITSDYNNSCITSCLEC